MTSVLQSQHDHYAEVRRRLYGGSMPPDRPRRIIVAKDQPHRPDLPQTALPHIRRAPTVTVEPAKPVKRPRDFIHLASPDFVKDVPARQIIRECCAKYQITMPEMLGPKRFVTLVQARQEAAFRMSKETRLSLTQIGRRLGDRDHTTILHAIRRHQARLAGGVYIKARGAQQ